MPSTRGTLATPPGRSGCSVCPGVENATSGSKKSMPAFGSRSLGRRSLDAVRSIRGSTKGRRALDVTTNQKTATHALSISAESSPVGLSAKQRWYDSLRRRSAQTPTPSSPASMSSALKRSRFFKSSPVSAATHDIPISPSAALQSRAVRVPLPRLELPSFQAELQQSSIFGAASEKSISDTGAALTYIKRKNEDESRPPRTETSEKIKLDLHAQVAAMNASSTPKPKEVNMEIQQCLASRDATPEARSQVTFADTNTRSQVPSTLVEPNEESGEAWRAKCALYYKGTPWQSERTEVLPDATAALSQFALRHISTDRRRCSNVIVWTGELPFTTPRTNQTLTVYPHCDGPRRIEMQKKYSLEWAFIAFTEATKSTRLPPMKSKHLSEEDTRLIAALQNVTEMGYHIDVWTCRDNENWNYDVECIRDFGHTESVVKAQEWQEGIERRERYEAFIRHGVAGFLQDDLKILDDAADQAGKKQQTESEGQEEHDGDEHDGYEYGTEPSERPQLQPEPELDMKGFVEHQDGTTTAEVDETLDDSSANTSITLLSEDIDMAQRLGMLSINDST